MSGVRAATEPRRYGVEVELRIVAGPALRRWSIEAMKRLMRLRLAPKSALPTLDRDSISTRVWALLSREIRTITSSTKLKRRVVASA